MNIFVTVGTTKFDPLIEAIDAFAQSSQHSFTYQIADGDYIPRTGNYFSFTAKIDEHYDHADIIITHAGAGSIYTLLERRKIIIIVPNLERVDKHQSDIANFMENNCYALVCSDVASIANSIINIQNFTPREFKKTNFFKQKNIASFLLS